MNLNQQTYFQRSVLNVLENVLPYKRKDNIQSSDDMIQQSLLKFVYQLSNK